MTTVAYVKLGGSGNAEKLLEEVGIGKEYWQRNVLQLSGGQQQRVAIARALASDAHVLLADEPTGNLDSRSSAQIMDILAELTDEGATLLLVTHDAGVARRAGRRVRMEDGGISEEG